MLQRIDPAYEQTFTGSYIGDTGGGYSIPVVTQVVPVWIISSASRPTALTAAVAAAPAGGTGAAAGGWDTAAHRDTAIALLNNLKTRVDEMETKLRSIGALA